MDVRLSNRLEITGSEEPILALRRDLDQAGNLSLLGGHTFGISASTYKRMTPKLGMSRPQPVSDTYLAVVQLQSIGPTDMYRGGQLQGTPDLRENSSMILEMSGAWAADLQRPFHSVDVHLARSAINTLADELGVRRSIELSATMRTQDDTFAGLARLLLPAMERPREANALFISHIFSAIRLHIIQRYGNVSIATSPQRGTLARWQESRARELLEDGSDLTIEVLAAECNLSPTHFKRLFKQTFGSPPHQWRLIRRIERVKAALRNTDESLIEIALANGFADQSHLTRVFARMTGVTPAAWKRAIKF
jgi:AraC family transcriptional regulator